MEHFALFGAGIAYSRSPFIHQAIFAALHKSASYEIVDCPKLTRARLQGYRGCNVTIPHKETALALADVHDVHVQAIGATNTLVWRQGKWEAYNTDWLGFLRSIDQVAWQNKRVLLIGAGGAAKAVYYALQQLNCTITVANRTLSKCDFVTRTTRVLTLDQAQTIVGEVDYVVQATNQDFPWLQAARFVYDLRYTTTKCHQNGLLMLIHQAIAAQEYFWEHPIDEYQQLAVAIERKITNEINRKTSAVLTLESTNN